MSRSFTRLSRGLPVVLLSLFLVLALAVSCDSSSDDGSGGVGTDLGGAPSFDTAGGGADSGVTGGAGADAGVNTNANQDISCWIISPAADAVIRGDVEVQVGVLGPVADVALLVNGNRATHVAVGDPAPSFVTLTWTPHGEGEFELQAVATRADAEEASSEAVTILIDNGAPVVSLDLDAFAIVEGEVTVPVRIHEGNVYTAKLIADGETTLAEASEAVASFSWATTAADDGVHWLTVEVVDLTGARTLTERVPVVVANEGAEAAVVYDPGARIAVPENYATAEYHTKVSVDSEEGITRVISWLTWDPAGDWLLEYSLGQGTCPHNGIQYVVDESNSGAIVFDLPRAQLSDAVLARFPADERESDVFPVNDDPRTFGKFFGHIAPKDPEDHVNETLPIEIHYVFFH